MNQMSHITLWVPHCQHKYTNGEVGGWRRQICGCTHANLDRRQDEFSLCNREKKNERKNPLDLSSHSRLQWPGQSPLHWQTPLRCHRFIYEWVFSGEETKKKNASAHFRSPRRRPTRRERAAGADPSGRGGTARRPSWSASPPPPSRSPSTPSPQMKSWSITLNLNRSLQSSADAALPLRAAQAFKSYLFSEDFSPARGTPPTL